MLTAQVTEAEAELKAQSKDTVEGWKTGGVLELTFQKQHFELGGRGQSSMSLNGIFSVFANYKIKRMDNSLTWVMEFYNKRM